MLVLASDKDFFGTYSPNYINSGVEEFGKLKQVYERLGSVDRIAWFQNQVAHLRKTEKNPGNYRAAVSGFLAEIDRMQLEVREYFSYLPTETAGTA